MITLRNLAHTRRSAFSMLELVVIVVILAILAGVLVPVAGDRPNDELDGRRASDLKAVQDALELYHLDHGAYPSTAGKWVGDAPNYGCRGYDGDGYIPELVPDYLPALPKDPDDRYPIGGAGYLYRSDGTNYKFLAHKTPTRFDAEHPYHDPTRPTWAWQVSSTGATRW